MKRVRSASRSLDRSSSNIESYSASRSRSVSQLSSQEIVSSQSIPSSLEVHVSRETVIYNGFCRAPDYYSKLLGPTVDESILVGLQMLINTGFLLPNCTEPPPKYELPSLESSSDVAAQTESSETKSGSSQTIEQISMSTPSDEVPIGISKEEKSIDYDESTESETPAPASVSSESLNILSSTITSEELIVEPSKVETEIIPESIEAEALFEEEEILEESEELTVENSESIYDLETLFEEKVVDDPVLEKPQEVVIPEKIIDIIPEKVEELLPEKLEEIILEKTKEQIVTPSIVTDEKSSSEDDDILRLTEIVKNATYKSQDDSKTSTFQISAKESVNKNRIYTSKFPAEIVVATATNAQDDQPEFDVQESKISKASVKSSHTTTNKSKMADTDSKKSVETKESKRSRRGSNESKKSATKESTPSKISSRRDSNESNVRKISNKTAESTESTRSKESRKEQRRGDESNTSKKDSESIKLRSKDSKDSRTSDRRKYKQDTIKEVTETDTDQSLVATGTTDTTSRSCSSVCSGYDDTEEKTSSKKPSKEDKSSSTYSILKSTTSSKSKESSTDSYVCSCHIQAGSEQQNVEKNRIRCVCPCSYCPRCDAKKKSKVIPCPFLTPSTKTEVPPDRSCQCANMVMMKNQNERNGRIDQDQKLLCDCYTSTSSTGYASSSESCNMQRGDCSHAAKCNVRYAITKITEYGKFTTFEVMKSTKKVPKFIPKSLEGVFVLKHKS